MADGHMEIVDVSPLNMVDCLHVLLHMMHVWNMLDPAGSNACMPKILDL